MFDFTLESDGIYHDILTKVHYKQVQNQSVAEKHDST